MEASKLKEILEQHRLWIETNGVQGKCADLEGADLEGADLYCANLINADLEGAILCIADFWGADLRGANIRGANLLGAKLNRANLSGANLRFANLNGANLHGADLSGANLHAANLGYANLGYANLYDASLKDANLEGANLTGAIGLPNVSWVIPGCLVQLNENMHGFYLKKENKLVNFVQDSFGFFIQNNVAEETFDMLVEDRIIRNIPHWVKYSGLKQIASESV